MEITKEMINLATGSIETLRAQAQEMGGADHADELIEHILALYARDHLDAVETEGCVVLHLPEASDE